MSEQWAGGEAHDRGQSHQMGPEPEPQPEPEFLAKPGGGRRWIFGVVAAVLLLGGLGYSAGWFASEPSPASTATAVSASAAPTQGFSLLQPVTPTDQGAALQGLVMNEADKSAATRAVQNGGARLAWLACSDSGTEDGDIVSISGAGFNQTVPLLKQQTRLAVPYTPGTPIKVFAKKDGFAPGVTVAVYVGGSVFKLKTMKEGETIEIAAP